MHVCVSCQGCSDRSGNIRSFWCGCRGGLTDQGGDLVCIFVLLLICSVMLFSVMFCFLFWCDVDIFCDGMILIDVFSPEVLCVIWFDILIWYWYFLCDLFLWYFMSVDVMLIFSVVVLFFRWFLRVIRFFVIRRVGGWILSFPSSAETGYEGGKVQVHKMVITATRIINKCFNALQNDVWFWEPCAPAPAPLSYVEDLCSLELRKEGENVSVWGRANRRQYIRGIQ